MTDVKEYHIIQYILGNTNKYDDFEYNHDYIVMLVNTKIELLSGCKIYNKNELLEEIKNLTTHDLDSISKIIVKNILMEIPFNNMFRKSLNLSLIFNKDEPTIFYNDTKIDKDNITNIRIKILENHLTSLPSIYDMYLDTILTNIIKFIDKDLSVTFTCTEIPTPWYKLFKLKCIKHNIMAIDELNKHQHITNIITGVLYKQNYNDIKEDVIMKDVIHETKDEDDSMHRMEIMVYMSDSELGLFLTTIEEMDNLNTTDVNITYYMNKLIGYVQNFDNNIIKFYFINKLFKFIMLHEDFMIKYPGFLSIINKKLEMLSDNLFIIQSTGMMLADNITTTFISIKGFLQKINSN
jgi:hypothetical protein